MIAFLSAFAVSTSDAFEKALADSSVQLQDLAVLSLAAVLVHGDSVPRAVRALLSFDARTWTSHVFMCRLTRLPVPRMPDWLVLQHAAACKRYGTGACGHFQGPRCN